MNTLPWSLLMQWRNESRAVEAQDPDAMVLSTATRAGEPSSRVVLCRGMAENGIRFFTNYESRKANELDSNPFAALLFFWPNMGRQVRIEGRVKRGDPAVSDAYFRSRPRGHQLSAWASPQSHVIGSLDEVRKRHAELEKTYEGRDVPRPEFWGGYELSPSMMEFWQNGDDRLHTRRVFRREKAGWVEHALAP